MKKIFLTISFFLCSFNLIAQNIPKLDVEYAENAIIVDLKSLKKAKDNVVLINQASKKSISFSVYVYNEKQKWIEFGKGTVKKLNDDYKIEPESTKNLGKYLYAAIVPNANKKYTFKTLAKNGDLYVYIHPDKAFLEDLMKNGTEIDISDLAEIEDNIRLVAKSQQIYNTSFYILGDKGNGYEFIGTALLKNSYDTCYVNRFENTSPSFYKKILIIPCDDDYCYNYTAKSQSNDLYIYVENETWEHKEQRIAKEREKEEAERIEKTKKIMGIINSRELYTIEKDRKTFLYLDEEEIAEIEKDKNVLIINNSFYYVQKTKNNNYSIYKNRECLLEEIYGLCDFVVSSKGELAYTTIDHSGAMRIYKGGQLLAITKDMFVSPTYSPDGNKFYYMTAKTTGYSVTFAPQGPDLSWNPNKGFLRPYGYGTFIFSNDSKYVAWYGQDGDGYYWILRNDKFKGPYIGIKPGFHFSDDSKSFIFTHIDNNTGAWIEEIEKL